MNHDGIMTLLEIPNKTERLMALKSKRVSPFHLRHALQDNDPDIRRTAALHPNLTHELIHESLLSGDDELKALLLTRPDLSDEHLELMSTDPKFALDVARHPRTTDIIRENALLHPIPEGVKEIHSRNLNKNIGFLTFPLLGEGRVYTYPMTGYTAHNQSDVKSHGALSSNYRDRAPTLPHERQINSWVSPRAPVRGSLPTQRKLFPVESDPFKRYGLASRIDTGKSVHATEHHEAQHSIFSRIAQKHGGDASARVIARTLSKLPSVDREHLKNLFEASGRTTGDPMVDPEESITYIHNYLQSPTHREGVHKKLGWSESEGRASLAITRKIWSSLRKIGMSLTPEEVGIEPEKHQDKISKWVKTLTKRESKSSDQLGFSVSFVELIAIAEFITRLSIDRDKVRDCLRRTDGDPKEAVLLAYGLATPEGRKAFESVKKIGLHKAEGTLLKSPRVIEAIGPGTEKIVNELKQAYNSGDVEPVALGGNHSIGAHIARCDGALYLLKPGSGKKSPAAGVEEIHASQSRREACFAGLAQLLQIEQVKPAFLIGVDGREVAVVEMWPMDWTNLHRTMSEEPNLPRTAISHYDIDVFKWSVLDYIGGNPDRHGNNLMVGPADEGNKIGLIDHGSAFAGYEFDPGNDKNSFVPYYLRVWAPPNFHGMTHENQLKSMPQLCKESDDKLKEWAMGLNPKAIETLLLQYGIDPGPTLSRLSEIQTPSDSNFSSHLNKLWLEPPQSSLS